MSAAIVCNPSFNNSCHNYFIEQLENRKCFEVHMRLVVYPGRGCNTDVIDNYKWGFLINVAVILPHMATRVTAKFEYVAIFK